MTKEKSKFVHSIYIPTFFVLTIFLVKIIELYFEISFIPYGLYPRTVKGFFGIATTPLIHSNFKHLFSNAIPLLVLGISIEYFYVESSKRVFATSFLATGFFVWIFARESYHVGASGLVYALVSFLFFSGIFKKDKRAITLSLLMVFLYGGLAYGIFPTKEGVSWESHLIGGIIGLATAFIFRRNDIYKKYDWEEETTEVNVKNLEVSYTEGYQGESDWRENENSNR